MARVALASLVCMHPPERSWCSRQASTSAAETSMAESNPKPTRLADPAARPAVTATIPSIAFQAIVATFNPGPAAPPRCGR